MQKRFFFWVIFETTTLIGWFDPSRGIRRYGAVITFQIRLLYTGLIRQLICIQAHLHMRNCGSIIDRIRLIESPNVNVRRQVGSRFTRKLSAGNQNRIFSRISVITEIYCYYHHCLPRQCQFIDKWVAIMLNKHITVINHWSSTVDNIN